MNDLQIIGIVLFGMLILFVFNLIVLWGYIGKLEDELEALKRKMLDAELEALKRRMLRKQ